MILLSLYHDLFTITDIETLARLSDALALEGVPLFTFHFPAFHLFYARRAITELKTYETSAGQNHSLQQRQVGTIGSYFLGAINFIKAYA